MGMNRKELEAWIKENGSGHVEHKHFNGIDYGYVTMNDGWIAVFEVDRGIYLPRIQSKNEARADSWCAMREAVQMPLQVL